MIEILNEHILNSTGYKELYIYEKIFSSQFNIDKILYSTLQLTCTNLMDLSHGAEKNYIKWKYEKILKIKNNNFFIFIENLIPKSNYLKNDLTLLDYFSYKPFKKKLVEDDYIFKFKFNEVYVLKTLFDDLYILCNNISEDNSIIIYLNRITKILKNSNEIINLEFILFLIKQTFDNTDFKLLERYLIYFYVFSLNIFWDIDIIYPIINYFYLMLDEYKYDKIKLLINLNIYSLRKIISNSRLKKYNLSIYELNNILNLKRSIIMINFFNGYTLNFYYDNTTNFSDLKNEICYKLKIDYKYLNYFGFILFFADKNNTKKKRLEFKTILDFEYISDIIYLIENKIIENHKYINLKLYFTLKLIPIEDNNIFNDFIYLEFIFQLYYRIFFTTINVFREYILKVIFIDSNKENIEYILNDYFNNYYYSIYYNNLDINKEKIYLREKYNELMEIIDRSEDKKINKELLAKNEIIELFNNNQNKFLLANLFNIKIINSNFVEIKNLKNNIYFSINNYSILLLDSTFRKFLFKIDIDKIIKWETSSDNILKIYFIFDFEEIHLEIQSFDYINIAIFIELYTQTNLKSEIDIKSIIKKYNFKNNLDNFNYIEDYY